MNIKFTTSSMCVKIEDDGVVMYTIDMGSSEGVEIPMSYCAATAAARSRYSDNMTITLDACGRRPHMDHGATGCEPRYVVIPISDISEDAFKDDKFFCRCTNTNLCMGVLEILSAIENINGEYLSTHDDDPTVIRNVSKTMCLVRKAKGIIGKRLGETKASGPAPRD